MTIGTTIVGSPLYTVLSIYLILLIARIVVDYVFFFARDWRPTGFVLVIAEVIYTVTDPPIKLFRRFIPPLRLGGIAIDLAFTLTMIVVFVLMAITRALAS